MKQITKRWKKIICNHLPQRHQPVKYRKNKMNAGIKNTMITLFNVKLFQMRFIVFLCLFAIFLGTCL